MTGHPGITESWLGLCPKHPALHTMAAVRIGQPETIHPAPPDGSGPSGRTGRIRDGIGIAAASLKALIRDRQMLRFALLAGIVMLFLILAQAWSMTHIVMEPSSYLAIPVGDATLFIDLQQNQVIALQSGNVSPEIDLRLFLMEIICLSGFILLLAGLVLYRSGRAKETAVTVREGWAGVRESFRPLAVLSTGMAFMVTIVYPLIHHSRLYGGIVHDITMTFFWLPYSYYQPEGIFAVLYASANFFALEIMVINGFLFLAALYLVPAIVLEKKGLLFAITGSAPRFQQTWREVLGCILVFAVIVLGVAAVGLAIGQSPALLNHDYDFFLSGSRGYLPMMVVCYGFIAGCWFLMAAGFTAAGSAITDLYHAGTSNRVSGVPEGNRKKTEPAL